MSKIGMTMMLANRNRSNRGGDQNGQMNYETRGGMGYSREQPEMEMGGYGPEARRYSRDRQGQFTGEMEMNRTYEYGPKSGGYSEGRDYGGPENESGERFRNHWGNERDEPQPSHPRQGMEPEMNVGMRHPIGFESHLNRDEMQSDASVKRYREMDHMSGQKPQMGKGESESAHKFSPSMAEEWVMQMKNADGSKGPHWSLDQARQIIKHKKLLCDPYKFWAVMNAIYSDYGKTIQKHGVHNQDFYVDMAMDWLSDEDAVEDKPAAYYTHVVKH